MNKFFTYTVITYWDNCKVLGILAMVKYELVFLLVAGSVYWFLYLVIFFGNHMYWL